MENEEGKWPDLGLNPFPFNFSFINNPPTTQFSPNHTLSTPPPTHFPLRPKSAAPGTCLERETEGEPLCVGVLFSCGSKQRMGKVEKAMR